MYIQLVYDKTYNILLHTGNGIGCIILKHPYGFRSCDQKEHNTPRDKHCLSMTRPFAHIISVFSGFGNNFRVDATKKARVKSVYEFIYTSIYDLILLEIRLTFQYLLSLLNNILSRLKGRSLSLPIASEDRLFKTTPCAFIPSHCHSE